MIDRDRPWNRKWIEKFKADPEYCNKRFKIINGGGYIQHLYVDPDLIDLVTEEEFQLIEEERIPLDIGSQCGINPRMISNENSTFLNGEKIVALLCKSLLSGSVAGVKIYKIEKDEKIFVNRVIKSFLNY